MQGRELCPIHRRSFYRDELAASPLGWLPSAMSQLPTAPGCGLRKMEQPTLTEEKNHVRVGVYLILAPLRLAQP
jgi:hypothetical protein